MNGLLLTATANVVLAMNGLPEPQGSTDLGAIVAQLNKLAADIRKGQLSADMKREQGMTP